MNEITVEETFETFFVYEKLVEFKRYKKAFRFEMCELRSAFSINQLIIAHFDKFKKVFESTTF